MVVKTTVELDEKKLKRVMELTGLPTRREAIDFALSEAERSARIRKIAEHPWSAKDLEGAIDEKYDLLKMRRKERPQGGNSR